MKIIITAIGIVTFTVLNAQKMENFKLVKFEEFDTFKKKIGFNKEYQDAGTHAHIKELGNGEFLLLPPIGSQGLWIKNKSVLDSILATRIPIEDKSAFADVELQEKIKQNNADFFITEIESGIGIKIRTIDNTAEYFNSIEKAINQYGLKKFMEKYYIHFGYLLGEIVKKDYKVEWDIIKQYRINPIYEPILLTKSGFQITPYYKLQNFIINKSKFKIASILEGLYWFCKADDVEKVTE